MFVKDADNSIQYVKDSQNTISYLVSILRWFKEPEKELRKLKLHVASSIVLTIPITFLFFPHMFLMQFDNLFPMRIMHNSN